MGVFEGGCDLPSLAAVAGAGATHGGEAAESDPLELAAQLQDLSLITVTEGPDGEPRIGMLETIRGYALQRLTESGELEEARQRHAQHYAALAEWAHERSEGPEQLAALDRLEAEHANLRAALTWSLETAAAGPVGGERTAVGLRLVQALAPFWYQRGHATEGRRWLERAIDVAPANARAPLARMTHGLGMLLLLQDELGNALELFERSLAIWRELGDWEQQARELSSLGRTHRHLGDLDTARSLLEDSASISRQISSEGAFAVALMSLGQVETAAGNLERAAQLLEEALPLNQKLGDVTAVAISQLYIALNRLFSGRVREATEPLSSTLGYITTAGDTLFLIDALELSAAIAAQLGDVRRAACLTGAAEAIRRDAGIPAPQSDADMLEHFLAPARAAAALDDWNAELAAGRALSKEQAIKLLRVVVQGA